MESFNVDRMMQQKHIPAFLRWRWIRQASRDNARTPMQWTAGSQAGFTTGTPWLPVNGNHTAVNYASQRDDASSALHYYRRMIALRARSETLKYGVLEPLHANRRVMAYTRTLSGERYTVILNLSGRAARMQASGEMAVRNTGRTAYTGRLAPCEAVALRTAAEVTKA